MTSYQSENDQLLTTGEVAALFRVDPKTVMRWAQSGRIKCVRTLGGHRRYSQAEIMSLLRYEELAPAEQTETKA